MANDYGTMEAKWQARWAEAGLDRSERDESKPKFMIIFAYPGVTGYLHVGHLRGYTYVDAINRYKRMTGYNVLFPVGTHATGNGGISLFNRISRGDEATIDYLKRNGCTDEELASLKDPMSVVEFFNKVYVNDYWKRFGFLADWRRFTCTLYPDYGKFIQWQFRKLHDAGLLIQKPYYAPACPSCGPVAVDPSETDISKGGRAETQEYTLLKFRHGDEFLIAATLRPETVYGQVCFWVNPEVEYRRIRKDGEVWIVSPQASEKLQLQKDGIEEIGTIPGAEMIGWMCEAPMIHREIPVFPATFCDPDVGTGLVTSVPSDAPDDWISLEAVKKDPALKERYGLSQELIDSVVPISIIEMKGYGDFPAKDMIDRLGIKQPGDPKLSYVAGLNNTTAKNIVAYREENGAFTGRKQVLKVPKLGPKAFEQCAGFLRVPESKNVLDHTGVHPESYEAAEKLLSLCGYSLNDVAAGGISALRERVKEQGEAQAAQACGVGVPTLRDIVAELMKPGRDPRDELPKPILRTDVLEMKDLKPGMELTGTVRNVIDFGVFVDIGVHQDGLVHISQLGAPRRVRHPSEVCAVGDIVTVWVLEVDEKKKRISLTMKKPR